MLRRSWPLLLLLLVLVRLEQARVLRLRDGGHDAHAAVARSLDGFLDLLVLQLVVGLEVEDLVLGARREDAAELISKGAFGQRPAVEEVTAELVDAQHDLVVALWP